MQPPVKPGLKPYSQLSIRTTDVEKGELPGRTSNRTAPQSLKVSSYLKVQQLDPALEVKY